jgi:hypothetical protein
MCASICKKENWHFIATGVLSFVFIILPFFFKLDDADHIGSYISGFASSLAFIWLMASYQQQSKELQLQRSELVLQRQSLDNQSEELDQLGKYAALEQMARMIDFFEKSLEAKGASIQNLYRDLTNNFETLPLIFKEQQSQIILENANRWLEHETRCMNFLKTIVAAGDLYLEASGMEKVDKNLSIFEQIDNNKSLLNDMPYVGLYMNIANSLVLMLNTKPMLMTSKKVNEKLVTTFNGVYEKYSI